MIKVVLIDDEPLALEILKEYLSEHLDIEIVGEANNGFDGFKIIQNLKPELIFLDVQMPKLSGFEMLELLDEKPSVIFTTAFDQYAVKAFEYFAVDYLLKPISKTRFETAISKFKNTNQQLSKSETDSESITYDIPRDRIVVKENGKLEIIYFDKICFFEANDDYINIYTELKSYKKKITLSKVEQFLNPSKFVKTHRSYILNLDYLKNIEPYEKENFVAILESGHKVQVSKAGYVKLREILGF